MSNSFPNMICNEPPPLDQSEEEDDDSEEINFSSNMKFDIDPSPMSTPRKSGGNTSSPPSSVPLPILNGMSTPDILPIPIPRAGAGADADSNTNNVSISADNDNFDFTDSRTRRFESESMQESWIGNNTIPTKKAVSPMSLNTIMKTSYIGTMESEDDELETETDAAPNQDPVINPNPSESSVQVDFSIGVGGAAIVDDFADFSQPSIPSYQPPEAGIDDTVNFQADAINFLQAQDPLPNSESVSNLNLLDTINTTTSTSAEGVGFDFDDFQEFQSIPSAAKTTTSAIPSTTENLEVVQVQDDCSSITEKNETVLELEEEKPSEPILGSADNELALSGETASIENNETVDPDSPKPATPTEVLNFEDTKLSEEREDIEAESGSISHLQIESESEPSCDIDAPLHLLQGNSGENSDIFQDADASLEIHNVANNIKVENINLEAGDFVSQTPDSFEADFGDFTAFESTPAQFEVTDNFRQNTDNDTTLVISPSAQNQNIDQSTGINFNSSSSSEFLPSIERNFDSNDTDEVVVVQATSQSQSEYEPKQTLISSKDLPLENSSSSNFHSFSEDEDDFDDFQAFKSTVIAAPVSSTTVPSAMPPSCSSEPVQVMSSSSYVAPTTASAETTTTPTAPFQFTSWNNEDTPMTFTRKGSLMEEKFENLVKSLFVLQNDSAAPDMEGRENSEIKSSVLNPSFSMTPIDKQLKENDKNEEWSRVEDFEGSQGLLFKWPNSTAYQRLLQSLKIDNSTIVYSGKWGAIEVPRFAASLVDSPLLPVQESGSKFKDSISPCSPDPDSETEIPVVRKNSRSESHQSVDSITDNDCPVQHQISSSSETTALNGSVKPLGCHLSTEAEQILNQLPDLSFMRAKTLVFPNNTINTLQTATSDHVV